MLRKIRATKMLDFEVDRRTMKIELDSTKARWAFTKSGQTQKTALTSDFYHEEANSTSTQHLSKNIGFIAIFFCLVGQVKIFYKS